VRTWLGWITGLVGSGGGIVPLSWFGKGQPALVFGIVAFLIVVLVIAAVVFLIIWAVDDGSPGSRVEKIAKLIKSFRGTDGDGPPQGAPG
jgi:hypothetical protein